MTLTAPDYERLLGAVQVLNSDSSLDTLAQRTMDSVLSAVSNDVLVFDGFGTDNDYSGYLWYSPANMVWDHLIPVLADLVHQNPVYEDVITNRTTHIVGVSRFAPLAEFHRTEVYNEFYRQFDADTQLSACLAVSPELYVTCSLHRAKRDFSDEEWKMLELLAPHLVNAFRNAQFIQKLNNENKNLQAATEAARHGVVTVDSGGGIVKQTPIAARLLAKYFGISDRLTGELAGFVAHHGAIVSSGDFYLPHETLKIKRKGAQLIIRLTFESEAKAFVLLLKEEVEPSPADLRALGLTKRETEILFHLAMGKTNVEIGLLCSISPLTVKKHLENIYPKLGVETRSSATAIAVETMSKGVHSNNKTNSASV